MEKLKLNVGDIFGEWTVIDVDRFSKNGHTYVQCQCSCGTIKDIASTALLRGKTSSCKSCSARRRTIKLEVGSKYKHWTILEGPIYKNSTAYYKVKCDCGTESHKLPTELLSNNKCFQCENCAHKENMANIRKKNGEVGNLSKTRYTKIRKAAGCRNLTFNVTIEYLWNLFQEQKQMCAITGDYISNIEEASLDRIDSSIGYEEGNVQWVTIQANLSKHTMAMSQLYEFCEKVLNHANQQPSQPLTKLEGSETNS